MKFYGGTVTVTREHMGVDITNIPFHGVRFGPGDRWVVYVTERVNGVWSDFGPMGDVGFPHAVAERYADPDDTGTMVARTRPTRIVGDDVTAAVVACMNDACGV